MDWFAYIKRYDSELVALPKVLLQKMNEQEDLSLDTLLRDSEHKKNVSAEHLRRLVRARRAWQEWCTAVEQARERFQLPDDVWESTQDRSDLAALERTHRMLAMAETPPPQEAWIAGVKIWQGCFKITHQKAELHCKAKDKKHPRYAHYGVLLGRQGKLVDLPTHRWLAARKGEQEAVLQLQFTKDLKSMLQQVALYRSEFGAVTQERTDKSLLQELVLDELDTWLRWKKDHDAQYGAMQAACRSYRDLLEKDPIEVNKAASIFIGHEQGNIGLAWLDGRGNCIKHQSFPGEDASVDKLKQALEGNEPEAIMLPVKAAATKRLNQLEQAVTSPDYVLYRVREAGCSIAREIWTDPPHNYPKEVASAIVLGNRILRPMQEWSRIDPVKLGLADYQDMLEPELLRSVMKDELAILRHLGRGTGVRDPFKKGNLSFSLSNNPLVKGFDDLKPGMTLRGLITNITDFGAFVNIGLTSEGLVHLSELSDRFIRHPSEVVSIGKEVTVRVLSTERQSRRIALTMRSANKPRPRPKHQQKAKALQDLENLFKK